MVEAESALLIVDTRMKETDYGRSEPLHRKAGR